MNALNISFAISFAKYGIALLLVFKAVVFKKLVAFRGEKCKNVG